MKNRKNIKLKRRFMGGVLAMVLLCESILANTGGVYAATEESPAVEKNKSAEKPAGTNGQAPDGQTEDLHITADYRLEQDMVVGNLTISDGSLDLNGYELKVLGDIQHSYGAVRLHEGTLLCDGNFNMDDRGYLSMQSAKDTLFVSGNMTVQSDEASYEMSAGVIEVKGDFTQKSGKVHNNFAAEESHKVIFSGERQQSIHFDSPASYFNRVILQNTSAEGIITDGVINAREMERNGVEITSASAGRYGWTLQKDEDYEGDLILLGDTLDLNGYTLSVRGNLIQMNGTVKISGGHLKVGGDCRIQSNANETNEYSGASAWLSMTTPQDLIEIGGDFITESVADHTGMLRDGTMAAGGDVIQKRYFYNGNFATTSGFLLQMCGKEQQKLDMHSKLSGLEVTNEKGIELINEMEITGNIADHGNPVSGEGVVQQYGTTFADGSFQGTLIRKSKYKMSGLTYIGGDLDNRADLELKEDLTVNGNVRNTKLMDINGRRMEVRGAIENNGELDPYGGQLICDGDFYLQKNAYLSMDTEQDYLLVKGNFHADSEIRGPEMQAGTLELKGDFIHTSPSITGNFRAAGTHRTIFSGTSKQTVCFADKYSYLNEVEIFNTSEEGVYAPKGIPCKWLKTNGNVYQSDVDGRSGWTLTADEVYEGDLHLLSGTLDLNGFTLTVRGNFIQAGGTVVIHGGRLVVDEDYRIQSAGEQGGETFYRESSGSLSMTDKDDRVVVKGSFVMGSVHSHRDKLTNGEITVAGDVTGVDYGVYDNFVTSGKHVLTLNGLKRQTVCLSSPSFLWMRFANLRIENESAEGVVLEGSVPVEGRIEITGKAPKGTMEVKETTAFENGSYEGDVLVSKSQGIANLDTLDGNLTIRGNVSLTRDLSVSGTVTLEDGSLDMNGHRLTVGKQFLVQGKQTSLSGEGVLELKGDFRQEEETEFSVSETCRTVFSGTGRQTVQTIPTHALFSYVEILNTSEEGVYAEYGIPCQYLETNGNVYRTAHEGSCGWKLSQGESFEGDLTLVSGTLDLQGNELTVKGNLIQKGGNVNIHGGTLRVEGDYVLGDVAGSGQNRKQTTSWGVLQMREREDRVYIRGEFIMASSVQHSRNLTNGEMHVAGNMTWMKTDSGEDSMTAEAFTLVLDGTERQTARMERGTEHVGIANLIVDNACEQGVYLDGLRVAGSVLVRNGVPQGALHAVSGTEFLNECYPGDVTFDKQTIYEKPLHIGGSLECSAFFTLGADARVEGNFQCMEGVALAGHRLETGRDVILCGGELRIQKGELLCGGNLRQIYRPQESCGLEMLHEEDYVLVRGNMYVDSYKKSRMEKGVLELKGNFTQLQYGAEDAFLPEKTFMTIASGDEKQTVYLAAPKSGFGIFEVQNESTEGVCFDNETVRVSSLRRNGCQVTCRGGVFGWTLEEDMVLEEDLYLVADELDLNGHTLQINGNVYASGGSIRIHGGQLGVSGALRLQAYDGHGTYSDSGSRLLMTEENDRVLVEGDFVIQTNQDMTGDLTAGTIEIKGDWKQIKDTRGEGKFAASGTHRFIFSGSDRQKITMNQDKAVSIANIDFTEAEAGVTVESDLSVSGKIKDPDKKASFERNVWMSVSRDSQIVNGVFGGNVRWKDALVLEQDLDIRGTVQTSYDMDLHGHCMKAGGFSQEKGMLSVNRGELTVNGNMALGTDAVLKMGKEEERILVTGDFQEGSVQKHVLTAGELEVKGDVTIEGEGFAAEESHRTKLSGKASGKGPLTVQRVTVSAEKAGFGELILTKDIRKYYTFSREAEKLCLRLTIQKEDSEAPSKVSGVTALKKTSVTVQLGWEPSEDDKGVMRYEVCRDGSEVGTAKDTKYTDTGLKPGRTYTYTVYAVDEAENVSEASEPFAVTMDEDTEPPTRPGGVEIVTRTGSAVVVGWKKARDNAGVKGYRIFRDGEQLAQTDSETVRYKDVVRTAGTVHTYQVCAFDEAGNCSEMSAGVTGSPQMPECLRLMPENGEELGGESVMLTLYYKDVGNSTGNCVRFQYRSESAKDWTDINEVLVGQKSEDAMTLSSSYRWKLGKIPAGTYKVRAVLSDADGSQAEMESEYRIAQGAPKAPQKILAECDNGVNEVSWNPSVSANCTGYEVYRAEQNGSFQHIQTLEGRQNISFLDREVTEGKTYLYYVKAADCYQMLSEPSQTVSVLVTEDAEPPAVLSLTAERAKLRGKAVLTAKAVDNKEVKKICFQYYFQGEWKDIMTVNAEKGVAEAVFDTTILPDGEYCLRARAWDRSGNVGLGYAEEFEIDNTGVGKVTIHDVFVSTGTVTVLWNPVPEEDIEFYVVEQWNDGLFEEVERTGGTLRAEIHNLEEDTEYRFRVAGYDDAGNRGEASEEIRIRTKKDTEPPRMTGWKPVYSYFRETIPLEVRAEDNQALGQMKVFYSGDNQTWQQWGSTGAPAGSREHTYRYDMDIKDLEEGKFYVKILLYDRAGNCDTETKAIRTFYKDTTKPDSPSGLRATAKNGFIGVEWDEPQQPDFESFDLYRKEGSQGTYECVARKTRALNYYDTSGAIGQEIFYKVCIHDQAGNTGDFSEEVSARVLPDTECPKVYGISPESESTVGNNPSFSALIADNRELRKVTASFRKRGSGDLWTKLYEKVISDESIYAKFDWKNETLNEGTYEFRISAEDASGNVSEEYQAVYTYDRDYVPATAPSGGGAQEAGKNSLAAILPEQYSVWQGSEKEYDGTDSVSGKPIVRWSWDFGNGHTAEGARVIYAYPEEGNYNITLTVRDADGNENSVTSPVVVHPENSGGIIVNVRNDKDSLLRKAQVYVQKKGEKSGTLSYCDENGAFETALEDGTYEVSAYIDGHLPKSKMIEIRDGHIRKIDFILQKKEVVSGILSHRKLTPKEIIEKGVDLEDKDNWIEYEDAYEYEIYTYRLDEPSPRTYWFSVSGRKWSYVNGIAYTVISAGGKEILAEYEKGKYLKQMFEVKLRLRNHSDKKFVLTGGEAELKLPDGLSLAGMLSGNENLKLGIADIPGQSQAEATWYIRGDRPGEYRISAGYHGYLQPFNAPVSVTIQDKNPVVVTKEDGMSGSDDDFVDDDDETRYYQICVTNAKGNFVKYALVELSYGDASASAITDENGLAILEVNEGDRRTFCLTVTHKDYQTYEDKSYQINLGDYMDSVRIISKKKKSPYEDENKEYEGDFELKYVTVNGVDVSQKDVKINIYEDEKEKDKKDDENGNTVRMTFSEKASDVAIVMKDTIGKEEKIVSKKDIFSKDATLTFKSSLLKKGCDLLVKAKDEETGAWHLYRLKRVTIVEKIPEDAMKNYKQEIAEQCALYSTLAYKWVIRDGEKNTDGFTYDTKDKKISISQPDDDRFINLDVKMEQDGFIVEKDYSFQNYDDPDEDNCSYTIAYKTIGAYTYVYVVIRGTDGVEWFGNMKCNGYSYDAGMGEHNSFLTGMECVRKGLLEFLEKKGFSNVRLVITGHSRGAAVANLLAKKMIEFKNVKGREKEVDSVVAYTFATPNCTLDEEVRNKKYHTIFNFCLRDDFVPQVPLEKWGYDKYGITFLADSEVAARTNADYIGILKRIRTGKVDGKDKEIKISHNSQATRELKEHLTTNWSNVYEYYNKYYHIHSDLGKMTLFEYMHNVLAGALVGKGVKKGEAIANLAFSMLDIKAVDIKKILKPIETVTPNKVEISDVLLLLSFYDIVNYPGLYHDYKNIYGKISEYFFVGSKEIPIVCQEYVFSTHNPDNYYALLVSGGFDTNSNVEISTYKNYSSASSRRESGENSHDAAQFRKTLSQTIEIQEEDGKVQKKTVAELLGWNIDDTATWEGVIFKDGRITFITLNQSEFRNLTLDLTGLDKLENLYCVFTGFKEIILEGCTSLKTLTALHNRMETIDVSDCANLTELDVRYNQLEKITLGEHKDIYRFDCNGNCLDIDSDETFLRVLRQVKENGGTSNYEGQMCQKDATYSQTDMQVIQKLLQTEGNAEELGWELGDIDTWSGVEWKTVSGVNYIREISLGSKQLGGELDVTALKYLQILDCSRNDFTSINVSGCKKLSSLSCYNCKLTALKLDGTDELLYLDCEGNYLDISKIEEVCKKIQEKEGSSVSYERQYILAGREAFNEEECRELERFAKYGKNNDYLGWDMSQPGLSKFLTWVSVDGEYRLSEINLLGADVSGELDLSRFSELKRICMIATDIKNVTLPDGLAVLDEKAFLNCQKLREVTLPDGLEEIGEWAFKGCISLKKMTFHGNAPKTVGEEAFDEVPSEMEIHYDSSKSGWDDTYWKRFQMMAGEPSMPSQTPETPPTDKPAERPVATEKTAGTETAGDGYSDANHASGSTVRGGKKAGTSGISKTNGKHQVPKVKITKVKVQKGKITVTLKKSKKVDGYEVYFRKGKKGKYKVRRSKGWKKNRITLKKLKRNSTYFVKARAYRVVGRKKYYSVFTKQKKFKVK